jgi:DNA-binding response OmpR family regulator
VEQVVTILVIDDEVKITDVIKSYLETSKYKVFSCHNGRSALNMYNSIKPELIILDLMLPDFCGEDICREIRKVSAVPIIMLTAKSSEDDKIFGLDIGADDYITKPFSPKELIGRVRAVLRRYDEKTNIKADLLTYGSGYLEIDNINYQVKVNSVHANITPNEYKILILLCKNPNKVFTREELVVQIFGFDYQGSDRVVDTHIKNLRHKIEKDSKKPEFILTLHGVGYKFGGLSNGN